VHMAWGMTLGFAIGLLPITCLQWFIFAFGLLILRANLLGATIGTILGNILFFLFQSGLTSFGHSLLATRPSLYPIWEYMYEAPIIPFTRFNHSLVLGTSLITLLLMPLVFF